MNPKQITTTKPEKNPFLKPPDTPTAGLGSAYLLLQLRARGGSR